MLAVMILCTAAALVTISMATSGHWLGLALKAEGNSVFIADVAFDGPARGTEAVPGFRIEAIGLGGEASHVAPIELIGNDLIEEPDGLDSYDAVRVFLDRQDELADLLQ